MNRRGFWAGLLVGLVIMGLIAAVAGFMMFRMGGTAACAGAPGALGALREGRLSRGGGYYGRMPMFGGGHMFFMPGGLLLIGALVLAFFAGKHWGHHHEHCHGHHGHRHHGEHYRHDCYADEHDAPEHAPAANEGQNVPPPTQA